MIRAFAAIRFPTAVKHKIDQALSPLRDSLDEDVVRWVKPDMYHLTLKFFGDVSNDRLNEISLQLYEAATRGAPFSLSVGKFGYFPNIQKPRVLWVGLIDKTQLLAALHGTLESELASIGFKPGKRQFHPHITIGRVHRRVEKETIARMRDPLQHFQLDSIADVNVKNVTLIRSDLTPSGPVYTLIDEFPLGVPN